MGCFPSHAPTLPPLGAVCLVPGLTRARPDARRHQRRGIALKTWVMDSTRTARGYILDMSETGARIGAVGTKFPVGTRVVVKMDLGASHAPIACEAQVVRFDMDKTQPDVCVRFLNLKFDDWFIVVRRMDAIDRQLRGAEMAHG